MKKIISSVLRSTAISIGIAAVIFCAVGVVFDQIYQGTFELQHYAFTKMVIGCIVTGIGFGLPTVIYEKESIPLPIRSVIHMGIGCIVYTATAFAAGWLPTERGIGFCVLILLAELSVAFLIWFCYQRYYRKQARRMNERIRELQAHN